MTSYSATGGLHLPSAATDYYDIATYEATVTYLQTRLPPALARVEAGIVCGSGLGGLVKCFDGETVEFDYKVCFCDALAYGKIEKCQRTRL